MTTHRAEQLELDVPWLRPPGSPAEQLTDLLMCCRRTGDPFDYAWRISIPKVDWPTEEKARGEWKRALEWAKREFRDAYLHPGSQPHTLVGALRERDTMLVEPETVKEAA